MKRFAPRGVPLVGAVDSFTWKRAREARHCEQCGREGGVRGHERLARKKRLQGLGLLAVEGGELAVVGTPELVLVDERPSSVVPRVRGGTWLEVSQQGYEVPQARGSQVDLPQGNLVQGEEGRVQGCLNTRGGAEYREGDEPIKGAGGAHDFIRGDRGRYASHDPLETCERP